MQYVVTETLWADKDNNPVRLTDPAEIAAARRGRHKTAVRKLTIPGQVFTPEQAERHGLLAKALSEVVVERSPAVAAKIRSDAEAAAAQARKARVAALETELAELKEQG